MEQQRTHTGETAHVVNRATGSRTRRTVLGAGAMLAAGALAACGAGASQSPGAAAQADAAKPAQVKPGTTLQWMYWSTPGPWLEANQKEAAEFEKKHASQGLKIEQMNVQSGQTFLDKLNALVAGGTPPDVAEIMPWDVPQFQARKALLNLTPMMKRDKYDLSDFFAAGFDQYRWTADGKPGGTSGADLWGVARSVLTVRFPERRGASVRVSSLAQPPDVTATILELSGADLPGTQGQSLVAAAHGKAGGRELAFSSRYPILAGEVTPCTITSAEWSYIYWPGSPENERLYDLRSDPAQGRDLRQDRPEIARDLRRDYLGWLAEHNPDMRGWLEAVERDAAFRPESPRLFQGML